MVHSLSLLPGNNGIIAPRNCGYNSSSSVFYITYPLDIFLLHINCVLISICSFNHSINITYMPLSMQDIWVQETEEMRQEQADYDWSETAEQAQARYNGAGAVAWSAEYETQKADILNFLDFSKLEPNHNVLDLGCGAGWLTAPAKKIAGPGRVVGVDCSPAMLQHAAAFCAKENVTGVELLSGDIIDLSALPVLAVTSLFKGFDRILVRRVFPMLPVDKQCSILQQWSRYLAPGGQIIADQWHRRKFVGAITTAAPYEPPNERVGIEDRTTWKECRLDFGKQVTDAGLKMVQMAYLYRGFDDQSMLYRAAAEKQWLEDGRSDNAADMTSRYLETRKREMVQQKEEKNLKVGVKVYTHPVSVIGRIQLG